MNRIRPRSSTRPSGLRFSWPLLLGVLTAASAASCDNPACIFGTPGCQTLPGGGVNAFSSTFPATGETVLPLGPRIDAVFPSGFAHPESPIVVVFNESVSAESVTGAFSLRTTSGLGTAAQATESLVGDGRVLILIPPPLVPGQEYELFLAEDAEVRDLSGALALLTSGGVVGTFTIDPEPGDTPQLLMSWPPTGATGVSPITEIVTVFDRPIFIPTITANSWDVQVDFADPAIDPLPSVLEINGGIGSGGATVPDSRVWSWSSVDLATDSRVSLGEGADVRLFLSSEDHEINGLAAPGVDAIPLAPTTIRFTTGTISAPLALSIVSSPSDAIGINNLIEPPNMLGLEIMVEFVNPALAGDVLEMFLVGTNPEATESGVGFISRQREKDLDAGTAATFIVEADLRLLFGSSPPVAVFTDGDVGIGFAVRRNGVRSAMRVLDVDLTTDGIQDARLDLSAPELVGLFGKEVGDTVFISDLRELSIAGVASEQPAAVLVEADINGMSFFNTNTPTVPPPVSASSADGTFVAVAVDVGQLDLDVSAPVTVTVFDRALNPSAPLVLQYTQRGGSGPGTAPPAGANVDVVVYDSETLLPVSGAMVYSHSYVGGVYDPGFAPAPVATDTDGLADVPSAAGGVTVFTVQAMNYDLFSFQGVPTTRLEIPLTRTSITPAVLLAGLSSAGSELSSAFIHTYVSDTRFFAPGDSLQEADTCAFNTLLDQTQCTFSPSPPIRTGEIGAVTMMSTKDPVDLANPNSFSAGIFLQVFELSYPRMPVASPLFFDTPVMTVGELLSGAGVDPQDTPLGTPLQVFAKPPNYALDFPNPVGDPSVSVEVLTTGLRGNMSVGIGRSYFDAGDDNWDILAAYTARAKAGGEFATNGTIEDDRLLRVELVDDSGNRTGVRRALSAVTGSMLPLEVPLLTSPAGMVTGPSYDLSYTNVIAPPMATEGTGLYRVILVDSLFARWHLWTLDPAAGGDVVTHLPPITASGGVALTDGIVACQIDAWAYESFDPTSFLFSDIARRHDHFTRAAPKSFTQVP